MEQNGLRIVGRIVRCCDMNDGSVILALYYSLDFEKKSVAHVSRTFFLGSTKISCHLPDVEFFRKEGDLHPLADRAAEFLVSRPAGLYAMQDMINANS